MNIVQRLAFNTFARTAAELINRGGVMIFWMMTARTLGAAALGSLAFALSLFNFFYNLCQLGLTTVIVRESARSPEKAGLYYSHSLVLIGAASALSAVLMFGVTIAVRPNAETIFSAMVLAIALIPASSFLVGRSLLYAAEKMPHVTIARTGESLFKIMAGLTALQFGAGVRTIAVILAVSKVMPALIQLPFVHRLVRPVWRMDGALLRSLIRMIPSFSFIGFFNSLFWTAPTILLTRICGEEAAGIYNAAHKLVDLAISLPNAYGQAVFPVAAKMLATGVQQFRFLFVRSLKYMLILTTAVAAMLAFGAEEIIRLLYGEKLLAAVSVLQILAWLIVPFGLVPILSAALVSGDLQKRDLVANAAAAGTASGVVMITAPVWGAVGTAAGYLAGSIVFMLIEWISVYRGLFRFSAVSQLWKPALGAVLMTGALALGKAFPVPVNLCVGGGLYLVFLVLSKSITRSEWSMIKNLITV